MIESARLLVDGGYGGTGEGRVRDPGNDGRQEQAKNGQGGLARARPQRNDRRHARRRRAHRGEDRAGGGRPVLGHRRGVRPRPQRGCRTGQLLPRLGRSQGRPVQDQPSRGATPPVHTLKPYPRRRPAPAALASGPPPRCGAAAGPPARGFAGMGAAPGQSGCSRLAPLRRNSTIRPISFRTTYA